VDATVVSVSMRRPAPLDTPLRVRREGAAVLALHGDDVVAHGEPGELELQPPPPVSLEEAEATVPMVPPDRHAFPTCFGCGPRRDPDEAIRIMIGPPAGRDDVMADTWTPLAEFADADGDVTPLFMWAALDCPTGWGAVPLGEVPHVLARLTARLGPAPARAGEPHVVLGWAAAHDGRKRRGGAAIYTAEGELCGIAEGLWIGLRDPSSHGAAGS
jgi:hypothetical protein